MSRDVSLTPRDLTSGDAYCSLPSGIAGAPCALSLPCPVHSARCVAHGKTAAEHVAGYADDCTAPPPSREGVPMGHCPSCGTYGETRMHWDTCEHRGRNRRDAAPRVFNVGGFVPQPEHGTFTTDAEVAAMARIVKAVEPLDERARKRVVAYVVERYGAPWRGVVS